jgi:hypothetical protein
LLPSSRSAPSCSCCTCKFGVGSLEHVSRRGKILKRQQKQQRRRREQHTCACRSMTGASSNAKKRSDMSKREDVPGWPDPRPDAAWPAGSPPCPWPPAHICMTSLQ